MLMANSEGTEEKVPIPPILKGVLSIEVQVTLVGAKAIASSVILSLMGCEICTWKGL